MKKYLPTAVAVVFLSIEALTVVPQLLQKWLWMQQLNYADMFWTLFSVQWGMGCVAFVGTSSCGSISAGRPETASRWLDATRQRKRGHGKRLA